MMRQSSFEIRTNVQGFTTSKQRITRAHTARLRVHGQFMEAPADTVDIAIVAGRRIYRGAGRYFLGLVNEEGNPVRLTPRAQIADCKIDRSGHVSSSTSTSIEWMFPCVAAHGDIMLMECGPVIQNLHTGGGEVAYFGDLHSYHGVITPQCLGFRALEAWTDEDVHAYKSVLGQPPHLIPAGQPVLMHGYLLQKVESDLPPIYDYKIEIRAAHSKPLANHAGTRGNVVDVRIEQSAYGKWAITNTYSTDPSLVIQPDDETLDHPTDGIEESEQFTL